jgi:hypothetical protein
MIAVAGPVNGDISGTFVKLPPADKTWIGYGYFGQGLEGPDIACERTSLTELIDSPIIRFLFFKRPGAEGCNSLGYSTGGISHSVKIITEVHGMQCRT